MGEWMHGRTKYHVSELLVELFGLPDLQTVLDK
jgi:hypothetical protein